MTSGASPRAARAAILLWSHGGLACKWQRRPRRPLGRVKLRVAWTLCGQLRSFGLGLPHWRLNVLDLPGNEQTAIDVFAVVTHEDLPTDRLALASLETLPEMRSLVAENQERCRAVRLDAETRVNVSVTRMLRNGPGSPLTLTGSSWLWRACGGRGVDTQYPFIGMAFVMAAQHASRLGITYDVAVRARPDYYWPLPFDVARVHSAFRQRASTVASGGEYLASDTANDRALACARQAAGGGNSSCYLLALGDMLMFGTFKLSQSLWEGMLGNQSQRWGYHATVPCCEDYLFLHLAYRLGVRQAPDAELVPTLPAYSWWANASSMHPVHDHLAIHALMAEGEARRPWLKDSWFRDRPVPGTNCSAGGEPPSHQATSRSKHESTPSVNEMCVPPQRHRNRCPWRHSNLQWWILGHRRKLSWVQQLAPYRAPLYRLKSHLQARLPMDSLQAIDWVARTLPAAARRTPETATMLRAFRCVAYPARRRAVDAPWCRNDTSYGYSRHVHFT